MQQQPPPPPPPQQHQQLGEDGGFDQGSFDQGTFEAPTGNSSPEAAYMTMPETAYVGDGQFDAMPPQQVKTNLILIVDTVCETLIRAPLIHVL